MNRKEEIEMSTIGGLTTSTTSSIRGYGGLASGMDRDSLIEGMTYGTTSKITQQEQKKQQLQWKQEAVRSITDQMLAFANKYTSSFSSASNLFSSVFWGRSSITTSGEFSKLVSVTGNAKSADTVSIMGVKQLAQKAKWSTASKEGISDGVLKGEKISTEDPIKYNLTGKSLTFKVGDTSATIFLNETLGEGDSLENLSYDTDENIEAAINKLLDAEKVGESGKLSDSVSVKVVDGKIQFTGKGGNSVSITGGTALSTLGMKEKEYDISSKTVTGEKAIDIGEQISFAEMVAGKTMTFTYNGVTKDIKLSGLNAYKDKDGNILSGDDALTAVKNDLQKKLNSAFGADRIQVDLNDGALSFKTTLPDGTADKSSSLTLVNGSADLVGSKGVLKIKTGESNRLNLNTTLAKAGFKGIDENTTFPKEITVNGTKIEITAKDSVYSLMEKINSKTNVKVSYQEASDKFTFTSKEDGASGKIEFGGDADFLDSLFGEGASTAKAVGQDAIVAVKYSGSDEAVELVRGSNSFMIDGLTINVKGEFGYKAKTDADGNEILADGKPVLELDTSTEAVEIDAKVNTDSIVDAIKGMVEEYNSIIEAVNKQLKTKPDRDYAPLTSEQKKELSEDEIKTYEEKAKEGLLFGDSDFRTLSSDLRFIIGGANIQALSEVGITTSSTYSDNGKLVLDESKLRAALENDPESVEKLFTNSDSSENGASNGLATNLKNVMDKYVNTLGAWESKGILIRKAGSESSPTSITENYIYKEIAEINKQISKLQTKLQTERDRYIKQFTSLETLISQMNSQSSWLAQIGGSY